ncbi:AAA family ATPase [Desulfuromonas acetoxidans]|uniref:SMC protein-like n=1 Tax=Desulfuromonas acetoxidans (strain DSM 684 / 11070) TaxID=281689 RepID=Q1K0T3_DESA6|nr:AAA family ATPase [Desulfuromonas acetoxidans]EAT16275.1 SMC protein-like [Desulfuromonas acetoxidans DSM 684]MBF0645086.1 AAA family ATPase [Desulfuromonas acetoxidans]NVD23105.1 AAA family ATPase [Desulfuromonas acetoxidans]NVE15654.1 AAA family ATPase [Desulfuromonas acetoxidans]
MILRSLELKSFGRFNDKTFEFRRGMNLVVGANEAGKSTMMASIPAVLFGLRDKQRYQPWGSQQGCQAVLQFESQQRNIRLERDVVTDQVNLFQYDGMYHLMDHFSAQIALSHHPEHYQQYVQLLRALLGISDEPLFRATQFVGQGDFPTTSDEFERFLRTILSGFTQGDSEMVLRSLKDDYDAVTSDNPWSGVTVSPRELEVVHDALQDMAQRQQQSDELLAELEQVRQQIVSLKGELAEDRQQLDEGLNYIAWIQQQWQIEAEVPEPDDDERGEVANADGEDGIASERQQLEQTLRDAGIPVPVPEDLTRLLADADEVRHQMVALQSEMIPFRDRLQKVRHPDWKRPFLFMLLMIVAGQSTYFLLPQWTLGVAILAGFGAVAGWGWFGCRFAKVKKNCQGLQEKIAALEQRRDQEQQRLTALDDEFEAMGIASSAVELVRIQKAFEQHHEALQRLAALMPCEDHQSEPGRAVTASERACAHDEASCSEHLTPEDLPEAKSKLDALEHSIHNREADLLALVRHEAVLLGRLAEGEQDVRHREQLEQRQGVLEQRKQVLHCAIDVLQQSLEEFHSSSLQCFEKRIAKYLRKATQNKYSAIAIEQDFSARLKSRNGQWVALEQLSRGTMDAVCLAIRLGLSHFLTPGKTLPFFLDDALINLDGERLQESVTVLERLSADHQIILFSHDERLHKIAARRRWHVIALSERRSRNVTRNKEGAEDAGQLSFL